MEQGDEVRMYVAFRRNDATGGWYLSCMMKAREEDFDAIDEGAARQCERDGDTEGAAYWRDRSNRRIVPVAVRVPAGVELCELGAAKERGTRR